MKKILLSITLIMLFFVFNYLGTLNSLYSKSTSTKSKISTKHKSKNKVKGIIHPSKSKKLAPKDVEKADKDVEDTDDAENAVDSKDKKSVPKDDAIIKKAFSNNKFDKKTDEIIAEKETSIYDLIDKSDASNEKMEDKTLISFNEFEYLNKIGTVYRNIRDHESWDEYRVSHRDMALDNWVIKYVNSQFNEAINTSAVKGIVYDNLPSDKQKVLSAKIFFPQDKGKVEAIIQPKFKIIEYNKEGNFVNLNNGIISNVKQIEKINITLNTNGQSLEVILLLVNDKDVVEQISFGNVSTEGWKTISWDNPDFSSQKETLKNKDMISFGNVPYKRFEGIMIRKADNSKNSECLVEFQDIKVSYESLFTDSTVKHILKDQKLSEIRKAHAKFIRDERLQEYYLFWASRKSPVDKTEVKLNSAAYLLEYK